MKHYPASLTLARKQVPTVANMALPEPHLLPPSTEDVPSHRAPIVNAMLESSINTGKATKQVASIGTSLSRVNRPHVSELTGSHWLSLSSSAFIPGLQIEDSPDAGQPADWMLDPTPPMPFSSSTGVAAKTGGETARDARAGLISPTEIDAVLNTRLPHGRSTPAPSTRACAVCAVLTSELNLNLHDEKQAVSSAQYHVNQMPP